MILEPLWISLKVASMAMLLVIPAGTAIAWWIGMRGRFPGKSLLEAALVLPLVLPPTVVGFALLLLLGHGTAVGRWLNGAGVDLVFTWQAAAIAAFVMSLPLFVRTVAVAFSAIDKELLAAARVLGASEATVFTSVVLPLSFRGFTAGLALAFARAMGEFGATLMIAGSIPGKTQTLSLALYSSVESGHDDRAASYAVMLVLITLALVASLAALEGRIVSEAHR